jgi:5-methylcytosine-specific restriction enzyme A
MPRIKKNEDRRPWMPKKVSFEHTSNSFYHTTMWRRCRLSYLQRNPLCVECKKKGEIVQGTVIDHITPIRLGGEKLEETNLQTLCSKCHNRKSAKEGRQSQS